MPNAEFLEEFQLYKKFKFNVPELLVSIPKVNINMYCKYCKDIRTFKMVNEYIEYSGNIFSHWNKEEKRKSKDEGAVRLIYECASCESFKRFFLIKIDINLNYLEKVGQDPPWDISIEKELEKILGDYASYYKKGMICELFSYGIGAYAYYRRIIEEIIDYLLDTIPSLLEGEDREKYEEALKKTKTTKIAQKKIELVYDLLPPILKPGGINSLKIIYNALSEGLHDETDSECLLNAEILRENTVLLAKTVLKQTKDRMEFTDKMKKLLEKKKK